MLDQNPECQTVHRAIADLRRGSMVLLRGGGSGSGGALLVMAAEQVTGERMAAMAGATGSTPSLFLTPQRARAIGLKPRSASPACSMLLSERFGVESILGLIGDIPHEGGTDGLTVLAEKEGSLAAATLVLMRLARLLPAAIASHVPHRDAKACRRWASEHGILLLETGALDAFEVSQADSLREVARASLPLDDAKNTEIAMFRPADGGMEHFALLVRPGGKPAGKAGGKAKGKAEPIAAPPLVRIHSQCLTGDVLGSLKCDCGDQLRQSIRRMADQDGGILVYLAQEGRDIGLVNKLKAYALQDAGLDTVEANHALGFESDHRFFLPAASILRQLGYDTIRLLTNNPDKIAQVEEAGIKVAERLPLVAEANPHNKGYIETKKAKAGHLID